MLKKSLPLKVLKPFVFSVLNSNFVFLLYFNCNALNASCRIHLIGQLLILFHPMDEVESFLEKGIRV
jgi:hypothetical protein